MTAEIQYQGRKARRAGSEQRRKAILEAALTIIVREGIRAVRHRAVAREANVPLSATTYYFKDISDLIADTFTLFAERAMAEVIKPFRDQAFEIISHFTAQIGTGESNRGELVAKLTEVITHFILDEAQQRRSHLVAEQAFIQEAILDERLRDLADLYMQEQLTALEEGCKLMGCEQPKLDGELIYITMMSIEQRLLVHPERGSAESVEKRIRNLLEKIVPHG